MGCGGHQPIFGRDPDKLSLPSAGAHSSRFGLCGGTGARGATRPDPTGVRLKLDENLPVELAAEIRGMGHDTDTVADEGL